MFGIENLMKTWWIIQIQARQCAWLLWWLEIWGRSGWSAVLHRGCFIKLVSWINEPWQKPPWHDIHETHWEAHQHARCISVAVLIVSNSDISVSHFVRCNVKSQWIRRLSEADGALWAKRKSMTKGPFQLNWRLNSCHESICTSGQMHYSGVNLRLGIFK